MLIAAPTFPEASGYGVAHFAEALLKDKHDSLEGKRCLIVGSGRVAQTLAAKLHEYGAVPITFSDSSGHIYEPEGFDRGKVRMAKNRSSSLREAIRKP